MSSVVRATPNALPHILKAFRRKELFKLQGAVKPLAGANPVDVLNPFLPSKTVTGKWRAPEYSLRRQKELVKAAKKAGLELSETLPIGPKTLGVVGVQRLQESIARTAAIIAAATQTNAENSAEDSGSSTKLQPKQSLKSSTTSPSPSSSTSHPSSLGESTLVTWSNILPRKLASRASIVATTRPGERVLRLYGGRKKMFKGHKWERSLLKRKGQIRVRLRDMQKRIQRFRHIYERKQPKPLSPALPKKKESLPF